MPVTLTKAELNKILVAERKKSLTKHKHSKFMSRTGSIYAGQVKRAREEANVTLTYSREDLRKLVLDALDKPCPYTGEKLTMVKLTVDHRTPVSRGGSWDIDNLVCCTWSANWQKGNMTEREFHRMMKGAAKVLEPVALDNFKRRLSMGGKWLQRGNF